MSQPNDKKIREVYDKIAEGFYNLRQQPITPEVKRLAEEWKQGKLLDVGCGIGNSTLPFAKNGFDCAGVDISPRMIEMAKKYSEKHGAKIDFKVGNILEIPFPEKSFDYLVSIAVLHHLDSEEKRLEALEEIKKVLKPEGKVFLTVWHKKSNKTDTYVSWTSKGVKYQRYYHFFHEDELKNLLEQVGFKKIRIFLDERKKNICAVANQ